MSEPIWEAHFDGGWVAKVYAMDWPTPDLGVLFLTDPGGRILLSETVNVTAEDRLELWEHMTSLAIGMYQIDQAETS